MYPKNTKKKKKLRNLSLKKKKVNKTKKKICRLDF